MFKVIINYNATKVIVVTAVVLSESFKFSKIKNGHFTSRGATAVVRWVPLDKGPADNCYGLQNAVMESGDSTKSSLREA